MKEEHSLRIDRDVLTTVAAVAVAAYFMDERIPGSFTIDWADATSAIAKMMIALRRTVAEATERLNVEQSEFRATRGIVEALNVPMQHPSKVFYLDVGVTVV